MLPRCRNKFLCSCSSDLWKRARTVPFNRVSDGELSARENAITYRVGREDLDIKIGFTITCSLSVLDVLPSC